MKQHLFQFLKYGSLNILGMLGISFYILADTFFIANGIGANGLSALNLAIPIYSLVHGIALMLSCGGSTKYTIAVSQQEHRRANEIFTNTLLTFAAASILLVLCGLFFSAPITKLLGADHELFEMTHIYLKVILLFSPFFIANEIFLAFVRNDGAPSLATTGMLLGSLSNIILDYIFIYPLQMGIFGAVLATGISPIVSMLILSVHFMKKHCGFKIISCPIQPGTIIDTMILGFPTMIGELSIGIVMVVFNILIMKLEGNIGVAAYGIIANVAIVTTAIYNGLAQGVQPLISKAHGTNQKSLTKRFLNLSLAETIILSAVLYIIMYLYVTPITALFNGEQNLTLQALAEYGFLIYFTSIPFAGINTVLSSYFTATECPMPAQIIAFSRGLVLIIPIVYILSYTFGITGIWAALPITELITAVIGAFIYFKLNK